MAKKKRRTTAILVAGLCCLSWLCSFVLAADRQPAAAKGEQIEGKVIGVADGDTITILAGETQYAIRLEGIDAPEKDQPFGNQAKKALSEKVFGKTVRVVSDGPDKYRRTLGIVYADGCVNTAMVREGWAWHYKEFSQSKALAGAEENARKAKAGLWADPFPTAPWEWRRNPAARQADSQSDPFAADAPAERPTTAKRSLQPRAQTAEGKYWITTSSGIRHNQGCRYFHNSKGRECGKDEGRACKICGG